MIRSMTGYFARTFTHKTYTVRISIRSLNHKYLEVNIRGNAVWLGLDSEIREIFKKRIERGKIDAQIDFEFFDPSKFEIRINYNLLDEIMRMVERFSEKDKKILNIDSIMKLPGIFSMHYVESPFTQDEEEFFIEKLNYSIDELIKDKEREGERLHKILVDNLRKLKSTAFEIEKIAESQNKVLEERFRKRLEEIYKLKNLNETRFYEELVYYIDKSNIREEIDRLKTHISYAEKLLTSNEKHGVGRKLTFIMQECLREVNTIGSKSQIKEISLAVVQAKELIENIREQSFNIE